MDLDDGELGGGEVARCNNRAGKWIELCLKLGDASLHKVGLRYLHRRVRADCRGLSLLGVARHLPVPIYLGIPHVHQ